MEFNKLEVIDFESGNINDFIEQKLLIDEVEEICYIHGNEELADSGSLYSKNDNIMSFKLSDMDEDDVDDCASHLIIMDGIAFDNQYLKQLVSNSGGTYVLRDFASNPIMEKELGNLINLLEVEVHDDINDILLESIKLVVDSEYYIGINDKVYYKGVQENKEVKTKVYEDYDIFEEDPWLNNESKHEEQTTKEQNDRQYQQQGTEHVWFEELIGNKVVELRTYESAIKKTYVDRTGQLYQKKNKSIALLLAIFLGLYGGDKFYLKRNIMGVVYIFTAGLFIFGWIYSIFKIANSTNVYAKLSKVSLNHYEKSNYNEEDHEVKTSNPKDFEKYENDKNFSTEIPFVTVTTTDGLIKVVNIVEAHKGIDKGIYTGGYELETIPINSYSELIGTDSLLNFGDENIQIYKGLENREIHLFSGDTLTFCALGQKDDNTVISVLVELLNVKSYYLPEEHIKLFADGIEVKYIGGPLDLIKNNYTFQILEFAKINLDNVKKLRIAIKAGYTSTSFEDKYFEQEFDLTNNK